jgi:hypothetical protein
MLKRALPVLLVGWAGLAAAIPAAASAQVTLGNWDAAQQHQVVHSSGQGVYVLPLRGSWLGDQFAWGRRVLP